MAEADRREVWSFNADSCLARPVARGRTRTTATGEDDPLRCPFGYQRRRQRRW